MAVGSCATGAREPGQAREGAAFIGIAGVPQIAWPSPHSPRTNTVARMEPLATVAPAFVDMAHEIVWATSNGRRAEPPGQVGDAAGRRSRLRLAELMQ